MSPLRVVGAICLLSCLLCLLPRPASAFAIYNRSSNNTISVSVPDGDFEATIAPGSSSACHWSNTDCNPSGDRYKLLKAWISSGSFICVVWLQAGGWVNFSAHDRSHLGVPPNLVCNSYGVDGNLLYSTPYGYDAITRDVRFLVTADPQYDNAKLGDSQTTTADQLIARMKYMLANTANIRGILVAGDLTQNARPGDEFSHYLDQIAGYSRFVFDGLGNHDVIETGYWSEPADLINNIQERTRATVLTNQGVFWQAPHYSWDWHDVHIVQLNVFPANNKAPFKSEDPMQALDFLNADLNQYVGNSRRPVVLVHHYGFDDFSTGKTNSNEVWWTEDQRKAYWKAIAPYNVKAIFTGHQHLAISHDNWAIEWKRPTDATWGPLKIPTFIAGASLNGVFLDASIDNDGTLTVIRRNSAGDEVGRKTYPTYPLAAHGGSGGQVRSVGCAPGQVAVGIQGRAGGYIEQLGLLCAYLDSNGSLVKAASTDVLGGTGGTAFVLSCPDQQAMVGLTGRNGSYVDQLRVQCASAAHWRSYYSVQSTSSMVGGSGGTAFAEQCPANFQDVSMVTSLNLRYGDFVDQVQAVCTSVKP